MENSCSDHFGQFSSAAASVRQTRNSNVESIRDSLLSSRAAGLGEIAHTQWITINGQFCRTAQQPCYHNVVHFFMSSQFILNFSRSAQIFFIWLGAMFCLLYKEYFCCSCFLRCFKKKKILFAVNFCVNLRHSLTVSLCNFKSVYGVISNQ